MQEKQGSECTAAGQISGISSSKVGTAGTHQEIEREKTVCSEKKKISCEEKRIFDLRKADSGLFGYLLF